MAETYNVTVTDKETGEEKEITMIDERTGPQKSVDTMLEVGAVIMHLIGGILGTIVGGVLWKEGEWNLIWIILGSYGAVYIIGLAILVKFYTGTKKVDDKEEEQNKKENKEDIIE